MESRPFSSSIPVTAGAAAPGGSSSRPRTRGRGRRLEKSVELRVAANSGEDHRLPLSAEESISPLAPNRSSRGEGGEDTPSSPLPPPCSAAAATAALVACGVGGPTSLRPSPREERQQTGAC